jgi:hypothetical protein
MSGLNDPLPAWLFQFAASDSDKINILLVLCIMLFTAVVVVAVRRRRAEREVTEIYHALGQFADCIERIENRQRKLGQDVAALLRQQEQEQEEEQVRASAPAPEAEQPEPRPAATVHQLSAGLKQLREAMAEDPIAKGSEEAQAAE